MPGSSSYSRLFATLTMRKQARAVEREAGIACRALGTLSRLRERLSPGFDGRGGRPLRSAGGGGGLGPWGTTFTGSGSGGRRGRGGTALTSSGSGGGLERGATTLTSPEAAEGWSRGQRL